jgi:hypothetical protein
MNASSPMFVAVVSLLLIGGGWGALLRVKARQHSGIPGVRTAPIPTRDKAGTIVRSQSVPLPNSVPGFLTKQGTVILMDADRTSIHQPEFCLTGNGWRILNRSTRRIPFDRFAGGGLEVRRFDSRTKYLGDDGRDHESASVYVFWFVADRQWTASHWTRTWWMTRDLLSENVLQRWAYVSYFAPCVPGNEDATYERLCDLIRSTIPEFQIAGFQDR